MMYARLLVVGLFVLRIWAQRTAGPTVTLKGVVLDVSSRMDERGLDLDGVPVQFVHIPKCGGNSINGLIMKHAATGLDKKALRHCNRARCDTHGCGCDHWSLDLPVPPIVGGHLHFGFGLDAARLVSTRPLFVTMVREPIRRLVSLVWFRYGLHDRYIWNGVNAAMRNLRLGGTALKAPTTGTSSSVTTEESAAFWEPRVLDSWLRDDPRFLEYLIQQEVAEGVLPFMAGNRANGTLAGDDERACAMLNTLQSDVLGDLDDVAGFVSQLHFHMPNRFRNDTSDFTMQNPSKASRQSDIISDEIRRLLVNGTRLEAHVKFHSFATRVAAARTSASWPGAPTVATIPLPDPSEHVFLASAGKMVDWCEGAILGFAKPAREKLR